MALTPEAKLAASVRAYLASLEPDVWHVKQHGSVYTTAGIPDLLICVRGRFAAIELKAPKGKTTPAQAYQLSKIAQAGGVSIVCRSLTEVQVIIQDMLQR